MCVCYKPNKVPAPKRGIEGVERMVKETGRKCSHCGHNGHNSRTCHGKGCVKLFGVNISAVEKQESFMKKSFSMESLRSHHAEYNNNAPSVDDGYLSDGQIHSRKSNAARERKRGKPWTEEEHRIFLAGLRKLGKGDWRGISKKFVTTRTPTQVASHAQKYFLRQAGNDKKKRRPSLFDMAFQELESNASPPGSPAEQTTRDSSDQVKAPSPIANRFPHLCLDDRPVTSLTASHSFPTYYHRIQPLAGGAPNGQVFPEAKMMPSLPFLHAMNYAGLHYGYMAKALGCAPAAHPSGIPSPWSVQHSMFRAGPGASPAEKDLLELKIGPPQSSKNTSMLSQASSISVI
ncbi:Myb-like transcription factor family protein, putative isoform 1 [Theobroma cacao]|uniref:Myb-like transcription factor family protein, putative isoform 1 n=1 Tax=Theobroma cacao TaxID=3641 RepID=A0A061G0P9_THECC|nr:Myb-like transcription factor family protein, putative isoform 1 [Theobroma cacao]